MSFFRSHRFLLLVITGLFAAGHAHQTWGRFETHHHETFLEALVTGHHVGESQDGHDAEREARHMLEHHAMVQFNHVAAEIVMVSLHSVAVLDIEAEEVPEAPVAGIDYPPQLVA